MINYQIEIKNIAKRIKEIRRSKKLTVQEVAYRCDIERSNLCRIEAGRTNLTIKTICLICNALNINLSDVVK
ncbi:MAG: helix-turn-helix domain-containing protein [Alistipes sp.]